MGVGCAGGTAVASAKSGRRAVDLDSLGAARRLLEAGTKAFPDIPACAEAPDGAGPL